MKSIRNLQDHAAGIPLLSDDVVEFHAARLLLLLSLCGIKGHIDGLTKLAKLDFFVRYPQFFSTACMQLDQKILSSTDVVEARMVRHHYGPWDKRYYHVLAFLESRELITVTKLGGKTFRFALTDLGRQIADHLSATSSFEVLSEHMDKVKKVFGQKSGSFLKNLIYEIFDHEVAQKPLGEEIQ